MHARRFVFHRLLRSATAKLIGTPENRAAFTVDYVSEVGGQSLTIVDELVPLGLLIARHSKGYYGYTGLAFFRQLPAGVPGAYRLFANLVSLGK